MILLHKTSTKLSKRQRFETKWTWC